VPSDVTAGATWRSSRRLAREDSRRRGWRSGVRRCPAWCGAGRVRTPANRGSRRGSAGSRARVMAWCGGRKRSGSARLRTEAGERLVVRRKKRTARFDGKKRRPGFFGWLLGPAYGVPSLCVERTRMGAVRLTSGLELATATAALRLRARAAAPRARVAHVRGRETRAGLLLVLGRKRGWASVLAVGAWYVYTYIYMHTYTYSGYGLARCLQASALEGARVKDKSSTRKEPRGVRCGMHASASIRGRTALGNLPGQGAAASISFPLAGN
jgi:hypothetical protein